ncbi:MAG: hypothetical protein AAF539_13750 [Planctomycetota bacterium]
MMLQIGDKYQLSNRDVGDASSTDSDGDASTKNATSDVSAESVTEKGRRLLEKQIEARFGGQAKEPVSWNRVAILAGLILLAIIVSVVVSIPK